MAKHEKISPQQNFSGKLTKRLKNVAIWTVIIAAVVLLIYAFVGSSGPSTKGFPTLTLIAKGPTDHWIGNNASRVLIVEYSDFQCPACAQYSPIITKAIEAVGNKFQIVYRNFPLKQIHLNAVYASRAAEAAALQDKYWEMNELLFTRQDEWAKAGDLAFAFGIYASELGLDVDKFKKDYYSSFVAGKVENDYQSGVKYNIMATPTFFMNGQQIKFNSAEELISHINRVAK